MFCCACGQSRCCLGCSAMHSQAGLPQDVSPFDAALSGPVGPGAILHSNGSAEKTGCLSSYLCALNERLESPWKKFRATLSACTFDPTFRGLLAVGARWSIFRAAQLLFWECCWTMLGRVELFSCTFEGLGAQSASLPRWSVDGQGSRHYTGGFRGRALSSTREIVVSRHAFHFSAFLRLCRSNDHLGMRSPRLWTILNHLQLQPGASVHLQNFLPVVGRWGGEPDNMEPNQNLAPSFNKFCGNGGVMCGIRHTCTSEPCKKGLPPPCFVLYALLRSCEVFCIR